MSAQNVCRYNRFGYCQYGEICRKHHVDELCDTDSCDLAVCTSRHPKECKYFRNYNRCKFNPCKFAHKAIERKDEKLSETIDKVAKIEDILQDRIDLEKKVDEYDEKINILENIIKEMELSMKKRKAEFDEFINREKEDVRNLTKKKNILQRLEGYKNKC